MPSIHIPEPAFRVMVGALGSEQKAKEKVKQLSVDYAKELVDDEWKNAVAGLSRMWRVWTCHTTSAWKKWWISLFQLLA